MQRQLVVSASPHIRQDVSVEKVMYGVVIALVPALAGALFFVAIDVWGLVAQGRGIGLPIGHGAHLGGALCGAVFYFSYLRGRISMSPPPSAPRGRPVVDLTSEEAAEFDRIRDKLSRQGPDGLTAEERDFLLRLRERALGESGESN